MAVDPAVRDHQAWLGYLQPDGLVVSATALFDSQVLLSRNAAPLQQRVLEFIEAVPGADGARWRIKDLPSFLTGFLDWPAEELAGPDSAEPIPEELKVGLLEFNESLEPDLAFRESHASDSWLLLIKDVTPGEDLDAVRELRPGGWAASHSRRLERLLRETQIPIGLLSNGEQLRLLYAPRGENAGTLTFPIAEMEKTEGRKIVAALDMLLNAERLLAGPADARLPALLKRSRDYQSQVSTDLAGQVLDALYELLRGFQAANERVKGELLLELLDKDPDRIYQGLLTVLMRLVFLLYAEDRGVMPGSELYVRNYAVHGLFERLRADNEQNPDTMDVRYGAWAQLAALFRAVHSGCVHPDLHMPPRAGHLFDPDRYAFLEGRSSLRAFQELPLVPDGTLYRVLNKLLWLKGERLSYRTLDVEQIGSVYETMMGFKLELATGQTIALKPAKAHGAPVPINLEELLATAAKDRAKWIAERTDYKLTLTMSTAVQAAGSVDGLLAALEKRIARNATPHPLAAGNMLLTPTDERRRTGSHYTPRSLTEPIVRKALEPIFAQLGESPLPEDILELKICDPAMGSGAFLVEACRQLADKLVEAYEASHSTPTLPDDEDIVLFARRTVAQRCLYGVDRNPMAVDLAKLSLWLATLARDHPFTFLDHSLRSGDSLVGLSVRQIGAFHWMESAQMTLFQEKLDRALSLARAHRSRLLKSGDTPEGQLYKADQLKVADDALAVARMAGDLAIAAFFAKTKAKDRELERESLWDTFARWLTAAGTPEEHAADDAHLVRVRAELRSGDRPVTPFHWELEYPEVFSGQNPGFDCIVGNPPFAGHVTIVEGNKDGYTDFLRLKHPSSAGKCDVVAFFFRQSFAVLRKHGTFGLIATNSIGQGHTRESGLAWLCTNGGIIYNAQKRFRWPGSAAVVVSIVHLSRGDMEWSHLPELNGRPVDNITAYLFHTGGSESPKVLQSNSGLSFQGSVLRGMGFTFDDTSTTGEASPISLMNSILLEDPSYGQLIQPFLGGEELLSDPTHSPHRYAINFRDCSLEEARRWPRLFEIVEAKVKPARIKSTAASSSGRVTESFWQYGHLAHALYASINKLTRVLAVSSVGQHMALAFLPVGYVYSHALIVFPFEDNAPFAVLQSRPHEIWARFFGSSLEDRLR